MNVDTITQGPMWNVYSSPFHSDKGLKKTVYTLDIERRYAPEITAITYPLIEAWAEKIGADFQVIEDRRFPQWPDVYEKMQIHELAAEHGNDWSIYIDADSLVHPDMYDVTDHIKKDTVLHNGVDMAGLRWKYDRFFRRDGRHIGSCNWFTVASDWCLDVWRPLDDLTLEEAVANIRPTLNEKLAGVTPEHLIDDYTLSRNIAKHGLKFTTVQELGQKIGQPGYLWHAYALPIAEKVKRMREVLKQWKLAE